MTTPEFQRQCWPRQNGEQPEFSTKPESMSSGTIVQPPGPTWARTSSSGRARKARQGFWWAQIEKNLARRTSQKLPSFARPGGWEHPPLRGPISTVPALPGRLALRCESRPGLRAQPVKFSEWRSSQTKAPAVTATSSMNARWNCTPIGTSPFRTFWEM